MFRYLFNLRNSRSTYHPNLISSESANHSLRASLRASLGILVVVVAAFLVAPQCQAQNANKRNGLAPCTTDSFVRQAGVTAELIYGDESPSAGRGEMNGAPPPYDGFNQAHRIETGIIGQRADGLTTGHGSYLPRAWGHDEFTGQEWSQSGASSGVQIEQMFGFVIPQR